MKENTLIEGGYYIKARCITNGWVSSAPPIVREVWDYLLREANHKDARYSGFIVKRGQLFRSYKEIRDALKWRIGYRFMYYHESSMKRAMNALRKEGMIELTSEPRGNLITICKYDYYQNPENYERTNDRTNDRTNGEPVANHQRSAINKNDKKKKNERIKNINKKIYADHVQMTEEEYQKLIDKYGEPKTKAMIEKLNVFKGAKGQVYKSDYMAILNWVASWVEQNWQRIKEQYGDSFENDPIMQKFLKGEYENQ
jgi:hypothetical protein